MKIPPSKLAVRLTLWLGALISLLLSAALAQEPPPPELLALDSDGDGQPDVAEWFNRTDAANSGDSIRIEDIRPLTGPNRLQLTWRSVAGQTYAVDQGSGSSGWNRLGQATATGTTTTFTVPFPTTPGKSLLRVAAPYDATRPPYVRRNGQSSQVTAAGFVTLTVSAYHPSGIGSVTLQSSGLPAAPGTPGADGVWTFQWPVDASQNGTQQLTLTATSVSGLVQSSSVAQPVNIPAGPPLTGLPGQFVKLDAAGEPVESATLLPDVSGNLPPCEWRPSGTAADGGASCIALRFPAGAKVITSGTPRLEFTFVRLGAATRGPLQTDGVLERTTATPQSLPLGPVTVAQLATLLGLDPAQGVPLRLFGLLPARMTAGTLIDRGLTGPIIKPSGELFDLLPRFGGYSDFSIDFSDPDFISLPFSGQFALPDATGFPAQLTIGPQSPAWVRIDREGRVSFSGRGDLNFGADGPRFTAELSAGDTGFALELMAAGLQFDLAAALKPSLPPAQTLTATTTADAATLNPIANQLGAKLRAYERFAAAFSAAAPAGNEPPKPAAGTSSLLDSLASTKISGATLTSPAALGAFVARAGRAASGAVALPGSLDQWLTLERVKLAGFTPAELSAARTEAHAALLRRFDSTTKPFSLDDAENTLRAMLEREVLRQKLGVSSDTEFSNLLTDAKSVLDRTLGGMATSWSVESGQLSLTADSPLQDLDRFTAVQNMTTLMAARRHAQLLGIDQGLTSPVAELTSQLGQRVEAVLRGDLITAELRGDAPAFLYAFENYAELHTWTQAGLFAPGGGPTLLSMNSLLTRYSALDLAWIAAQPAQLLADKISAQVQRLTKTLKAVPAGVTLPQASITRAHDRLRAALDSGIIVLGSATTTLTHAVALLRGGVEHARLRDQLSLSAGSPVWESSAMLTAIVDRIIALAGPAENAVALHECALLLLSEADRLASGDQIKRRFNLLEAQKLAAALRTIALAWCNRTAATAGGVFLAGGIAVDEAAGGVQYDAPSREVSGWCSGKLRMPGMGASFTLSRLSFSSGGAFSMEAHGAVTLPNAGNPVARFSVPARHPLRFAWRRPNQFSVAGGGKLEVNGMTFEAWATLDDPVYGFGVAASGLDFDLADKIRVMIPVIPPTQAFTTAALRDMAAAVDSLGAGFDTLGTLTLPVTPGRPGEPPGFALPQALGPFKLLEGWANRRLADFHLGVNPSTPPHGTELGNHLKNAARKVNPPPNATPDVCANDKVTLEAARAAVQVLLAFYRSGEKWPTDNSLYAQDLTTLRLNLSSYLLCVFRNPQPYDLWFENDLFAMLKELMFDAGSRVPAGDLTEVAEALTEYMVSSLPLRLSSEGIDPATGLVLPAQLALFRTMPYDHIEALMANLLIRQVHLQGTATDGSVIIRIGEALRTLGLNLRYNLVHESRTLIAKMPRAVGIANEGGYLPYGHPLIEKARHHGKSVAVHTIRWLQYIILAQQTSILPRNGDIVDHVLRESITWSDDPELQVRFHGHELDNAQAASNALINTNIRGAMAGNPPVSAYDPIITNVPCKMAGSQEIHYYSSEPRLEGYYGLKVAYGLAKDRSALTLRHVLNQPPPSAPAALKEAWENYRAGLVGYHERTLRQEEAETLAKAVEAEIVCYFEQPSLEEGLSVARDARNTMLAIERSGSSDLLPPLQAKLTLFDTAFRGLIATQKAWWYAGEYIRLWSEAAEATVDGNLTTLASAFTQLGAGAARAGFAIVSDLALLLPGQRPVDLALPGDLRIENVWGEVNYRADTGVLSGAFGGRLELPGKQAHFEVVNGTLNSTGAFSLTLSGGGPLPFAPDIKIDNVTGSLTGSTAGLTAFGANGRLHFPGASGDVSLNGAFSYTGAAGGQPAKVKFNAGITDAQNLPRFTDDLVLFNGAVGVEFPLTPTPPPVKLSVSGKAGLFHREAPLVAPIVAEDFWMGVDLAGLEMLFESEPTHRVTLTFNGGTLRFPADLFFTKVTPPLVPQPFTIALGGGLTGCYDFDQEELCFGNAAGGDFVLNLPTLGFLNIPGLPGSKVEITTARLRLRQAEFPVLDQLTAGFRFPLPSETNAPAAAAFSLNATEWRIDGLPKEATLQLTQDLPLLPWLQQASLTVNNGASFSLTDAVNPARPGYRRMTLTANGGMRGGLDSKTISTEAGAAVVLGTTGVFTWPFDYKPFQFGVTPTAPEPQTPSLLINDVTFEGRFRLGGANGFLIRGVDNTPASKAKIRFAGGNGGGIDNVLYRTAAKPFSIGFAGTLDVPAVGSFTIGDITDASRLTKFIWDQNGAVLPRFEPVGFNVAISGQVLRVADLVMPFYLTSAGMAFLDGSRPLLPGAGQTGLLDPSNIKIIASGVAQLPNGAALRAGIPGLRGGFTNVSFTFPKVNGTYTAKLENLSSLTLEVRNVAVPYISDVSGALSVRNIDALLANPPRPLDVYFAGQLTGKMRGAGGKVLLAASPRELLGACAGINGGVTGIPLDGYMLGGILLTGFEGGLSLQNSFANPCDFWTYAAGAANAQQLPAAGSAGRPGSPGPLLFPDPPGAPSSAFFDCTGPGFPPPTVNPFCQPHPDQTQFPNRVIFKGAWLTEAQLNSIGILSSDPRLQVKIIDGFDACAAGIELAATQVAGKAGEQILIKLQQLRAAASANPAFVKLIDQMTNDAMGIAGAAGAALDAKITLQLKELFRAGLMEIFEQVTTVDPTLTLYQLIVQRAREGLKCIDVTVRGNATFSWQPVSILFDVTGSAFLSTTGTEGVEGSLNMLGMPMGRAMMAFMITNEQGDVDPGIGGVGDLAIGPLGFGKVSFSGENGATVNEVVVSALTSFFSTVQTLSPAVQTWIGGMLQEVAGLPVPPLNSALNGTFNGLTEEQKLRLMSRFLGESKRLAQTVSDQVVRDQLFDAFAGILSTVLLAQETQLCMGGEIAPTLFGMPLTGGSNTLVGGGGSLKSVLEGGQRYYEMTMQTTFSPTICSLYPILYSYATALPQIDEATLGFSVRIPSPTKPQVKLALTNPAQWAKNMAATLVNDSVATANYEVAPLGFRLQDVRARLILPRADKHPNNPASGWIAPPSGNGYATREEVVLAALDRGSLGNAQWRGNAGDLDDLFRNVPGGTQCSALTHQVATRLVGQDPSLAAMSGKGFAADYFPHGGLIFGGQWQMPNVIAQAVPVQQIATVLAGPQRDTTGNITPQSILAWVNATKNLIDNYLLATTCTGQLSGYMPAPSPVPAGVNWAALQNDPGQWLTTLTNPSGLLGAGFSPGTSLGDNAAYATWANGRRAAVESLLQKVVNRDALLNGIYPFNQSFFKGWCQAQLLGLPLGQATASWDGQTKKLLISAQAGNASWLKDLVSAGLVIEVSPPQYVSAVNVPLPSGNQALSPEEVLTGGKDPVTGEWLREGLWRDLANVTAANYALLAPRLAADVLNVVPRMKLEATIDGTVPAAWQPYFSAGGAASVVAYSPGFDLAAADTTPEAAAKRNGGIALKGNLKFGPFLQQANAQASVLPGATGVPQLKADVSVTGLTIPGTAPVTVVTADGRATFDSLTGAYTIDGHLSESLLLPASLLPWRVTMPAATTTFHAAGNTITFSFSLAGAAASITVTSNGTTATATYQGTVEIPPVYVPTQANPVISLTGTGAGAPNIRVTVSNGSTGVMTNGQVRVHPFNQTAAIASNFAGVEPDLDFPALRSPAAGAVLNGFSLGGLQWDVGRTNGVFTVNSVRATLPSVPGFTGTTLSFNNGTLNATTGSFSLPASVPALTGNGFTLRGPAGGNVTATLSSAIGLWAQIGQFTAGSVLSGALSVPPGSLQIPAPGGFFNAITWSASATSPAVPLLGGAGTLAGGAGASITIDPDGGVDGIPARYFKVTGNLSAGVSVLANGWNVTMPAAAAVTITTNTAGYSFTSGGAAAAVAASYIGATPSFSFAGVLEIDPLVTGIFSIRPVAAGATKLALNISAAATATVAANSAKLRLAGPFSNLDITLPQLSLDTSYNFFAVNPSAVNATLKGYLLNALSLSVRRVGGLIEVFGLSCQLPAGSGLPAINLTGTLDRYGILTFASENLGANIFGFSGAGTFTLGTAAEHYQTRLNGLSPEAWWKLDEVGTFSPTADATGHGHTGSHTTTVQLFQPGAVFPDAGTSYFFNGTDASVSVPDSDGLEGGSAMAVTAWFRVNAFDRWWQTIVSKGDSAWRVARSANLNTISFDSDHVTGSQYLAGVTPVDDNQWHHVVAVYDGTRKYLYLDGELERSAAWTGAINSNSYPVMIGENAQATGRVWNGGIDEVAFFRRALSGEEVRNLYAAGIGAGLRFNGSVTVPGFTGASLAVNGSVSYDNAFTLSATLPQLTIGSFSLTAPGGGPLSLTVSNSGISVPNARLSLGSHFVPLDLPAFNIPTNGDYDVAFTPSELNLRGFSFPNPGLAFRRTGGATALICNSSVPSLAGLPAIPLSGSISSNGTVTMNSGSIARSFFGFDVNGGFNFGSPPRNYHEYMDNFSGEDPEAWWTLDETDTVSHCPDSGQWGHNGAKSRAAMNNEAPALYPSLGRSYDFNGTSDYVTIPDNDWLEGDAAMTISAWVKVSSFTRTWQAIVAKGDSSWRLSRYGDSDQVSFDTTSGGWHDSLVSSVSMNDGQWHHVTGAFDGSYKYIYVDGQLQNSRYYPATIDRNSEPVMIGENSQARDRYWHGYIDEVAFFRRGLSPAEVRELYAAGNGLRLSFNGSASLTGINPSVSGSITSGGGFDFATSVTTSPTVLGYGFDNASFLFRHDEAAAAASFTGSLRLNTIPTVAGGFAPLGGNPVFTAVFTKQSSPPPLIRVYTQGSLSTTTSLNLCGYAPASPGVALSLSGELGGVLSPTMRFSDFRFAQFPIGALNVGFPALSGTIGTSGAVAVTGATGTSVNNGAFSADLNLRNMIAANTFVRFNHAGLNIAAPFELKTTVGGSSHTWAWINFSGLINPAGSYSLAGNGGFSFGTHSTDAFNMRFRSSDYNGGTVVPDGVTPNLNFGNLDVSVNSLSIHRDDYSLSFGNRSGSSARHWFWDGARYHMKTTFDYDIGFGFNFAGRSITAGMNGGATWKWEVENFVPPPSFPSSGSFDISGSIGDGGTFTVNNDTASGNEFWAPFWGSGGWGPPPGWGWGNILSEFYDLWN